MFNSNIKSTYVILIFFIISCTKTDIITDNGEGITIEFVDGLNDDPTYQLSKDSNVFL